MKTNFNLKWVPDSRDRETSASSESIQSQIYLTASSFSAVVDFGRFDFSATKLDFRTSTLLG